MSKQTSFPYLAIARRRGLPYGAVIRFVQCLDICPSISVDTNLRDWEQETATAWNEESRRRIAVQDNEKPAA